MAKGKKSILSAKVRLGGKLVSGQQKLKARAYISPRIAAAAKLGMGSNSSFQPDEWVDIPDDDPMDIEFALDGTGALPISHAGGEFAEILESEMRNERGMHKDSRNRRDRVLRRNQAFQQILETLVDSYLEWNARVGDKRFSDGSWTDKPQMGGRDSPIEEEGLYFITVVDVYGLHDHTVTLRPKSNLAADLIHNGLIPCSPTRPSVAITIRTLEFFRAASLRCPRLAVQNMVKTLCDMHCVPYKPHLTKQYTICQDVYLSILEQVELRVQRSLGRDSPLWRLKHACPACTYSLKNEQPLKFSLLFTMDGNDSLKRVLRRDPLFDYREAETGDVTMIRVSNELPDQREVGGDYYVSRTQVARWMNGSESAQQSKRASGKKSKSLDEDDDSPCLERWKNMSEQHTTRAWEIFDETGVFVALCRHGFILLFTDMVKSGEGSQYPLAVVETLLDTFGSHLGGGYDIGCQFKSTLAKSDLGPRIKELSYTSLVGAFHGHAHNRICQLSHLATYVEGLGLSDLEGAERLFSRSNDLAASIRHSSVFHRLQRITMFFKHLDVTNTYEALSSFLVNNYNAALQILNSQPDFEGQMKPLGASDGTPFSETAAQWLSDEKAYLSGLSREPLQETFEMDYYRHLTSLNKIAFDLKSIEGTWHVETPETGQRSNVEGDRRRLHKAYFKTLEVVQELEKKLGITDTWQEGDANWLRVADMVNLQQYRRALDKLEQLVVSRMFELGKMNRSGTGYKLRQHISKALKTRSQAIRHALQRFNDAAKKLKPPRATLRWDEVVDFAFLSEFDLLADTRDDVRQRPWARPAARTLMDQYFKTERAKEEIQRLNIEIPRLSSSLVLGISSADKTRPAGRGVE